MQLCFTSYKNLSPAENLALLEIRNQKDVRMGCANSDIIKLSSHLLWLKSTGARGYFAVLNGDKIIGGLSLVKAKNEERES